MFKNYMGALVAVTLVAGAYGTPAQAQTPKSGGTLTMLQFTNPSALSDDWHDGGADGNREFEDLRESPHLRRRPK